MDTNLYNDNVITFPGPRIENLERTTHEKIEKSILTKDEADYAGYRNLIFSEEAAKDKDLAYELAFKKDTSNDIKNLYHRPKLSLDFELPLEIQDALVKLEIQMNQWDYLIRKISFLRRT